MIKNLSSNNFEEEIKGGLKLIVFSASWCGYCQKQKPILEELDKIWIGVVDGDKNPELAQKYRITGFPSFIIFRDGKDIDRFSGFHTKFDIMTRLLKFLKN